MDVNEFYTQWISALRSGEYKQGHSTLRYDDKFCCLGVACDLFAIAGEGHWQNGAFYHSADWSADVSNWSESTLPGSVAVELGLHEAGEFRFFNSRDGLHNEYWLTALNDDGFTFAQIADVIEYFHAPKGVSLDE